MTFTFYLKGLYELAEMAINEGIVSAQNLKYLLLGLTWGRIITESSQTLDGEVFLFKQIKDFMGEKTDKVFILDLFSRILSLISANPNYKRGLDEDTIILKRSFENMLKLDESKIYRSISDYFRHPIKIANQENQSGSSSPLVLRSIFNKVERKFYTNLAWVR